MNKNAIKKFAIEARKKLLDSVTDKAGMLGITEKSCSEPITKGADFEVYQTVAGTEVTLNKRQCEQRRRLVAQIESRGFEAVVEEVAYTWFNRICAIRFMEVNDYLPNRVRVLSSEKEGKMEPDLVTQAPDVELDLTAQEKEEIINWKMSGTSEDTDKLYCKLFLKQCHQLHDILPGLFEADSDYMELLFGISYTNKDDVIYMLVNPETGIPEADFNVSTLDEEGNPTGQVEIIGWLYQYYNTELKDDTFAKLKKNVKITKERIPAATQLFTPDWIVRYMVENSVGRIWIEHLRAVDPSTDEKATAERFGWKYYLPEAEQEESVNVKLAEIRTTYKDLKPTDITCIDPCMGSGHILIAMFDVLMDIYESAGYDKREAAFEIIEHNIHGLDIDQRAYQLAYFAVMMKGRGYNRRFLRGRDGKPEPKVYAIVESNEINRKHLQFFGTHLSEMERNLAVMQIEGLLDTFKDAREYGSILNVDACDWDVLEKYVDDLGTMGQISFESVGSEETQESLRKLVRVAKNLGQKYDAVVTNPPYMNSDSMDNMLYDYVQKKYKDEKSDLFSVFMARCAEYSTYDGYVSLITQQAWMFLSSFENLRKKILLGSITNMLHLGTRAFEDISGEVVQTVSFVWTKKKLDNHNAKYIRLVDCHSAEEKNKEFHKLCNTYIGNQKDFDSISGTPIAYWASKEVFKCFDNPKLESIAEARQGLATGNNNEFIRFWNEVPREHIGFGYHSNEEFLISEMKYAPFLKGGSYRKWYGNLELVIKFDKQNYEKLSKQGNRLPSRQFYFRSGLTWSALSSGDFAIRYVNDGFVFADKGQCMFLFDESNKLYLCAFLNSSVANYLLKFIAPTLDFHSGYLRKLPIIIDNDYKRIIDQLVAENIDLAKKDWNSYETSWDFETDPLVQIAYENKNSRISDSLQTWKNICNTRAEKMTQNEKKINELFCKIYSLNEVTKDVERTKISIKEVNEQIAIKNLLSYIMGCLLGRYNCEKYCCDIDAHVSMRKIVKDNILVIGQENFGEYGIYEGVEYFLKSVWGKENLEYNLNYIVDRLESKTDNFRDAIIDYYMHSFYKDHCNMYSVSGLGKRPIYWLFDSGKEDGFKAFMYIHNYKSDCLRVLRTNYLHKMQDNIISALQRENYRLENAKNAVDKGNATKKIGKYKKQLAEISIYDEGISHLANRDIELKEESEFKEKYSKFQNIIISKEGIKNKKIDLLAKIK